MTRIKTLSLLLFVWAAALSLYSCSGVKNPCTSNCGVGGNGVILVTVTSTPSQTFFFPYLAWVITSVQLVNSSSSPTIVQGALPPVDFARLQTDSQFLGSASSVPAGTYTSAKIQLKPSTASSYFYNSSGTTLFTNCVAGAVCKIPSTVAGFAATTVTVPVTFTVAANNNSGFSLNFDLSKAVTSAGGMTFDFTQSGAITLTSLPRKGQSSGLDSLENFTGSVTAKTSTSFSMASLSSNTRTFTIAGTAEFDDPFSLCSTPPGANFSCIATNQNLSVDATINSDGTLTAYEIEFLDKSAQEAEGVIVTPVSSNQFTMVATNGVGSSSFLPGTLATVTLNGASTYFVDPKNLGVTTTPLGFQSSSDLVVGQTVMLQGGSINFTTNTLSGYTRTLLRYSSIGGTVGTPSGTIFTLSGISPFFTNLSTNSVQVQTFANTTYDNVTGGLSGLANTNASVRGLYLNPNSGALEPLLAAQARAH